MPIAQVPAFVIYCIVSAITPGPANLTTLSAALKYGRKRAMIQWRGIAAGFSIDAFAASLIAWFFGSAFGKYLRVLTFVGAAYILWLAWHLYKSEGTGEAEAAGRCNFFTGLIVQLTNPKVIIFCITALTTYALPYAERYTDVLKVAFLLLLTGPVANLVWLFAGASLKRFFENYQKPVNIVMALSLVFCAISILFS